MRKILLFLVLLAIAPILSIPLVNNNLCYQPQQKYHTLGYDTFSIAESNLIPKPQVDISGRLARLAKPGKLKSAQIGKLLAKDLDLNHAGAAGISSNIYHESKAKAGIKNSIGAVGYAQWYKVRAKQFYKYAKDNGLSYKSDKANYEFLKIDIQQHWSKGTSFKKYKEITNPVKATLYMCNYW